MYLCVRVLTPSCIATKSVVRLSAWAKCAQIAHPKMSTHSLISSSAVQNSTGGITGQPTKLDDTAKDHMSSITIMRLTSCVSPTCTTIEPYTSHTWASDPYTSHTIDSDPYSAVHPQVHTRARVFESSACRARVARESISECN